MGSTTDLIARNLDEWNAHDRERWAADFTPEATLTGPGGLSGTGPGMARQFYDVWHTGFPECEIKPLTIAQDGQTGLLEAIFEGIHTGPLTAPAGTVDATGQTVSIPFVVIHAVNDGKFTAFRLYFDQLGMLAQLGSLPGTGVGS